MGFGNIANWRVGGKSTDKYASFSYTSLFGRINIQILNCPDSFSCRWNCSTCSYFPPFAFCIDDNTHNHRRGYTQVVFRDTISSCDDREFDPQRPKGNTRATSLWVQFSWMLVIPGTLSHEALGKPW